MFVICDRFGQKSLCLRAIWPLRLEIASGLRLQTFGVLKFAGYLGHFVTP